MKKSDELRQEISALKNQIETLQKEEKYKDALQLAEKLNNKYDQLKIEVAKEKAKFEHLMQHKELVTPPFEDVAKLKNRAFNKLVFRLGGLTTEEKEAYYNEGQIETIGTQGGYLVPQEQMATLQEFRKDFIALKDYVSVIVANSNSGRWATYPAQDLIFQDFSELAKIAKGEVAFGAAEYVIKDKGLILPISNQLIQDADIDVMAFLGRQLAEGAIKTENQEILKPLNELITADTPTITNFKGLNTALMKTLDGAYAGAAKIFTNQTGFLWLNNLEDSNNRPLLLPDIAEPSKYFYRGKEIVVIPNSQLKDSTINNKAYSPFFVGDLKAHTTLFERLGIEMATSSELYFEQYGMALRAVIRFGCVVTDESAMTALKVEV